MLNDMTERNLEMWKSMQARMIQGASVPKAQERPAAKNAEKK